MNRKNLTDILAAGMNRDQLRKQWETTDAAKDFELLPSGDYVAHIVSGELFNSKTNHTPGYKIAFVVADGEHTGRRFWHDFWFSADAMPYTKRDLAKLGVTLPDQLDQPLPPGIRCRVKLRRRQDDDGTERNRVFSFEVVGIDTPELDPFAPPTAKDATGAAPRATPTTGAPNLSPDNADADTDNQLGVEDGGAI